MDYYAIRSGEYEFLLRFYNEFENTSLIHILPNFAYSIALTKFFIETEKKEISSESLSSDELLQRALLHFPMVLIPLLNKCTISQQFTIAGKSINIANERYFVETFRPPSLEHLITLFTERAFTLWKQSEVSSWLQKNIIATLDRIKQGDPLIAIYLEDIKNNYASSSSNTFRHLLLSDYTDALNTLPPDIARNVFQQHQMIVEENVDISPQVDVVPAPTSNPLFLFLSSLFPWNQVPNAPYGTVIPPTQINDNNNINNNNNNDDDSDDDLVGSLEDNDNEDE